MAPKIKSPIPSKVNPVSTYEENKNEMVEVRAREVMISIDEGEMKSEKAEESEEESEAGSETDLLKGDSTVGNGKEVCGGKQRFRRMK